MKNDFNGEVPVIEQARYLSRHGQYMTRLNEKNSVHYTKYYLFNGYGWAVTYVDEETPVQIQKMNINEVIKISSCSNLEFGGF